MIGGLFNKHYWDDVFYTEIPPGVKEEDFLVIIKRKKGKDRKVHIRKKSWVLLA